MSETEYLPDCKCRCGRAPNISFPIAEVRRCRRGRQAARVTRVQCKRCGDRYWIRGRDIARAAPAAPAPRKARKTPETETTETPPRVLPDDFPGRRELEGNDITTFEALLKVDDLTALTDIGPGRAAQIQAALDVATAAA